AHLAAGAQSTAPDPPPSPSSRTAASTGQPAPTKSARSRTARSHDSTRPHRGVAVGGSPPRADTAPTTVFQIRRMICSWFWNGLCLRFSPEPVARQIPWTLLASCAVCPTIPLRRVNTPAGRGNLCCHESCAEPLSQSKARSSHGPQRLNLRWPTRPGSPLTESSLQSGTPNNSPGPATRCAKQACNCSTHSNALKCSTAAFKYGLAWPLPPGTSGRRVRGQNQDVVGNRFKHQDLPTQRIGPCDFGLRTN